MKQKVIAIAIVQVFLTSQVSYAAFYPALQSEVQEVNPALIFGFVYPSLISSPEFLEFSAKHLGMPPSEIDIKFLKNYSDKGVTGILCMLSNKRESDQEKRLFLIVLGNGASIVAKKFYDSDAFEFCRDSVFSLYCVFFKDSQDSSRDFLNELKQILTNKFDAQDIFKQELVAKEKREEQKTEDFSALKGNVDTLGELAYEFERNGFLPLAEDIKSYVALIYNTYLENNDRWGKLDKFDNFKSRNREIKRIIKKINTITTHVDKFRARNKFWENRLDVFYRTVTKVKLVLSSKANYRQNLLDLLSKAKFYAKLPGWMVDKVLNTDVANIFYSYGFTDVNYKWVKGCNVSEKDFDVLYKLFNFYSENYENFDNTFLAEIVKGFGSDEQVLQFLGQYSKTRLDSLKVIKGEDEIKIARAQVKVYTEIIRTGLFFVRAGKNKGIVPRNDIEKLIFPYLIKRFVLEKGFELKKIKAKEEDKFFNDILEYSEFDLSFLLLKMIFATKNNELLHAYARHILNFEPKDSWAEKINWNHSFSESILKILAIMEGAGTAPLQKIQSDSVPFLLWIKLKDSPGFSKYWAGFDKKYKVILHNIILEQAYKIQSTEEIKDEIAKEREFAANDEKKFLVLEGNDVLLKRINEKNIFLNRSSELADLAKKDVKNISFLSKDGWKDILNVISDVNIFYNTGVLQEDVFEQYILDLGDFVSKQNAQSTDNILLFLSIYYYRQFQRTADDYYSQKALYFWQLGGKNSQELACFKDKKFENNLNDLAYELSINEKIEKEIKSILPQDIPQAYAQLNNDTSQNELFYFARQQEAIEELIKKLKNCNSRRDMQQTMGKREIDLLDGIVDLENVDAQTIGMLRNYLYKIMQGEICFFVGNEKESAQTALERARDLMISERAQAEKKVAGYKKTEKALGEFFKDSALAEDLENDVFDVLNDKVGALEYEVLFVFKDHVENIIAEIKNRLLVDNQNASYKTLLTKFYKLSETVNLRIGQIQSRKGFVRQEAFSKITPHEFLVLLEERLVSGAKTQEEFIYWGSALHEVSSLDNLKETLYGLVGNVGIKKLTNQEVLHILELYSASKEQDIQKTKNDLGAGAQGANVLDKRIVYYFEELKKSAAVILKDTYGEIYKDEILKNLNNIKLVSNKTLLRQGLEKGEVCFIEDDIELIYDAFRNEKYKIGAILYFLTQGVSQAMMLYLLQGMDDGEKEYFFKKLGLNKDAFGIKDMLALYVKNNCVEKGFFITNKWICGDKEVASYLDVFMSARLRQISQRFEEQPVVASSRVEDYFSGVNGSNTQLYKLILGFKKIRHALAVEFLRGVFESFWKTPVYFLSAIACGAWGLFEAYAFFVCYRFIKIEKISEEHKAKQPGFDDLGFVEKLQAIKMERSIQEFLAATSDRKVQIDMGYFLSANFYANKESLTKVLNYVDINIKSLPVAYLIKTGFLLLADLSDKKNRAEYEKKILEIFKNISAVQKQDFYILLQGKPLLDAILKTIISFKDKNKEFYYEGVWFAEKLYSKLIDVSGFGRDEYVEVHELYLKADMEVEEQRQSFQTKLQDIKTKFSANETQISGLIKEVEDMGDAALYVKVKKLEDLSERFDDLLVRMEGVSAYNELMARYAEIRVQAKAWDSPDRLMELNMVITNQNKIRQAQTGKNIEEQTELFQTQLLEINDFFEKIKPKGE